MSRQQAGIAVADGLVDEDPAMLPIRLLEKSVVAERWDGGTWKDPFVDRSLDQRALLPTAFGDNGADTVAARLERPGGSSRSTVACSRRTAQPGSWC